MSSIEFGTYDTQTQSITTSPRYEYKYNRSGNLTTLIDLRNYDEYYYHYDLVGRVKSVRKDDGDVLSYDYDNAGNLSIYTYDIAGYTRSINYNYHFDELTPNDIGMYNQTVIDVGSENFVKDYQFESDRLRRLSGIQLSLDNNTPENDADDTILNSIIVQYFDNVPEVVQGNISQRIKSVSQITKSSVLSQTLTYNSMGYIEVITNQSNKDLEFYYDNKGQLKRENNEIEGYTYTYNYDNYGNMTSKLTYNNYSSGNGSLNMPAYVYAYTYDSVWKDKLKTVIYKTPMGPNISEETYTYDNAGNVKK